jgi:hypothetical protein
MEKERRAFTDVRACIFGSEDFPGCMRVRGKESVLFEPEPDREVARTLT